MKYEFLLIWKQPKSRQGHKVGVLTFCNNEYFFKYVNPELNDAIKDGFEYFPGFGNINEEYQSTDLFANIETRLPNSGRSDYLEILNRCGLDRDSTKLDILRETKGRLVTDNYEFVPAFDYNKLEFDVAGTRHYLDIEECKKNIHINDRLDLVLEPENEQDKCAIKVIWNKGNTQYLLGYVPRYYSKELTDMLKQKIQYSALIESLNFESAISDEDITASVKLIFDK